MRRFLGLLFFAVALFFTTAGVSAESLSDAGGDLGREARREAEHDMASAMQRRAAKDVLAKDRARRPFMGDRKKSEEPSILVGLMSGRNSVSLSSDVGLKAMDVSGNLILDFPAGKPLSVSVRDGRLVLGTSKTKADALLFFVGDQRSAFVVSCDGKKYRGMIAVKAAANDTLTVINYVSLDDYIGGVLANEMSPDWPGEALKAQAVAARTFALYSKDLHVKDGYDVCATTHCQVYGGVAGETDKTLTAVSATRGEILEYGESPIYAAFHSSSGGMTAGSEEAGGTQLPYLVPVKDDDDAAPNRAWSVELKLSELTEKLRAAGFDTGSIRTIELSPLRVGRGADDRYASGRVKSVRFIGSRATVEVTGPKLRWTLGLPGTMFEIGAGGIFDRGRLTPGKNPDAVVVFRGLGRGHGIGLSQWGARAMAKKKNYRDILSHYYKGVELKRVY